MKIEIKHQLPQKRTIQFENKLFYIQFPTMLFLRIKAMETYFYPILFTKKNRCYSLYGIFPNIYSGGLCISNLPELDWHMDNLISYFWNSSFTNSLNFECNLTWNEQINKFKMDSKWFEKIQYFEFSGNNPYKCGLYIYPINNTVVHENLTTYIDKFLKGLKNEV